MLQDFRDATRALRKSAAFTSVAVLTLAMGVGVAIAAFSLTRWLLGRPVPGVRDPGRLVVVWSASRDNTGLGVSWMAAYQVQRRKPGGSWEDVATSTDAVELLRDQPRGVELEFRVVALNRAGSGAPSATVTAVL